MNNYLSSIAARALNPAPPVRPLLRGRFDPAPLITETALDRLAVTPPESIRSRRHVDISRHVTLDTQNGRHNPEPQLPRHSEASRDSQRDTSEPPPTSPAIQMSVANITVKKTEHARPVSVVEQAAKESRIEHVKAIEPAIQTSPASRTSPANSPDDNRVYSAAREPNNNAQTQPHRAASRLHAPTSDDLPMRHGEQRRVPKSFADAKPVEHRETNTIVVREQKIIERQAKAHEPNQTVSTVSAVPRSSQPTRGDAKSSVVVVESRISPLVEKGPESISLSRPAPQQQPTVRVTIGRIEVRAIQSSQSPAKPRAAPPVMNLDDYLRRRNQGNAR